jgi:transmembrane sensor
LLDKVNAFENQRWIKFFIESVNNNDKKWSLISSYLAGESSDRQNKEMEDWIHTDPVRRAEIEQIRSIWNAFDKLGMDPEMTNKELEKKWEHFTEKMHSLDASKKKMDSATVSQRVRSTRRISPFGYILRIAAVITLMLGAGVFISMWYNAAETGDEYTETRQPEFSTVASQIARIQLRDGSNINLSVESTLRLGDTFYSPNGQRQVYLDGLAFFDVDSDSGSPFIIQTNAGIIKVLGTAFTVRAYSNDDQIQVVVMRGTVSFSSNKDNGKTEVLVHGGERAILDTSTGKIVKTTVDTDTYLKWIEGRIVFQENTLDEVARELERWFGMEFQIQNKALKQRRFSAVLDSKSLSNVLEVIGSTMNIHYTQYEHKVVFGNN